MLHERRTCDEIQDHLWNRCVHRINNCEVSEEFLGSQAKINNTQAIADALISTLQQWGMNLFLLVG